jgi:tetraacyldisaccharide 4''-kinase
MTVPGAIWLHAVSVGEVLTGVELIRGLREQIPGAPVFLSVGTVAGRSIALQRLAGLVDGVFYAPLDYRFAVRRVLRRLKPAAVVVLETEIWPNLYREAKRFGCGLIIVNGRISDKAFPKYRSWRWFFSAVLAWPDAILAQDERSAKRYRELGAERVEPIGNLKYDFRPGGELPEALARFLEDQKGAKIWIAASTMPPAEPGDVDEDDVVIDAFQRLAARYPDLLLLLAPRKPERFDVAAEKLGKAGLPFVRRSSLPAALARPGVFLLDSIGELSRLFVAADVVFVGGSLARRGGHNVLEPAAFGKAVVVGPHMENFAEIAAAFRSAGAMAEVASPDELATAIAKLLDDPGEGERIGSIARQLAEANRGATARAVERVRNRYQDSTFEQPANPLLLLLARLWRMGVAMKRARALRKPSRLRTPVVSVGGLSMGGTGKTPMVLWLAEQLQNAAILTRGYRRRSKHPVIVRRGQAAPVSETGDEAQIFVRSAVAAVGIGSKRYEIGRRMEADLKPSVFLLDDGFQHWQLHRDCDIVLIDALDPFAGGVFPAGRLRESPEALRRAHIIVLTRTLPGRSYDGIVRKIRQYNAEAPIFFSRVRPRRWVAVNGEDAPLSLTRAGAFCGLANPSSFWQSMEQTGVIPIWKKVFPDHHRYSLEEVQRMAASADVLLTTEKDVMNLPPEALSLPIYWLQICIEVEGEEDFIKLIKSRAGIKGT